MKGSLHLLTVLTCLLLSLWGSTLWATDIGLGHLPPPVAEGDEAPASLDETTLELFVAAVADLHKTATNLSARLNKLENTLLILRKKNQVLRRENARLRKTLELQAALPKSAWHAAPLDKEVRDANQMLEKLVTKLTGIAPR